MTSFLPHTELALSLDVHISLLLWTRMNPYIKKIIYCASICWSRYQNNVTVTRVERRHRRVKVIVVRCCEYVARSVYIYLCVQCWGGCCWLVLFIKTIIIIMHLSYINKQSPLKILCIYMYVKIACWSLSVQVGVLSFYSIHQFSCLANCSVGERQNALISVPNYML